MICPFATIRSLTARVLALAVVLIFGGLSAAKAADSCFTSVAGVVGDKVPFTMVSSRADNTLATYMTGDLTVFHSLRVGPINYLSSDGSTSEWFNQLLSNQFVPSGQFFSSQPFSIQNPTHPVFLAIYDKAGVMTLQAFNQSFATLANVQVQCGGAQNLMLIGSDSGTTYVVSFGTPVAPQPPPQ